MASTYIRWKIGEPRLSEPGRFTLAADHPLVQEPGVCCVCEGDFVVGDEIAIMAIGPDSPDNVLKHNAEKWYAALAAILHERCTKRGEVN